MIIETIDFYLKNSCSRAIFYKNQYFFLCGVIKMAKNTDLQKANKAKKDEFYTQLTDIEKELWHYKEHFKNKTVFCNCDDPYESNFFKYFAKITVCANRFLA